MNRDVKGRFVKGHDTPQEIRDKIAQTLRGNVTWNKGKTGIYSEDTRKAISEGLKKHYKDNPHPRIGTIHTEETRRKMSESHADFSGENNPAWKGGVAYEPYCVKFNYKTKEKVREKYGRKCLICGKSEKENGAKMCVHHVDYDKDQGCEGKKWKLVPLCRSCHSKSNKNRDEWQARIMGLLGGDGR